MRTVPKDRELNIKKGLCLQSQWANQYLPRRNQDFSKFVKKIQSFEFKFSGGYEEICCGGERQSQTEDHQGRGDALASRNSHRPQDPRRTEEEGGTGYRRKRPKGRQGNVKYFD